MYENLTNSSSSWFRYCNFSSFPGDDLNKKNEQRNFICSDFPTHDQHTQEINQPCKENRPRLEPTAGIRVL